MTARSEFRSNTKQHQFVMSATQYVVPRPMAPTWPRRVFWAAVAALMTVGAVAFGLLMVGAALTLAMGS